MREITEHHHDDNNKAITIGPGPDGPLGAPDGYRLSWPLDGVDYEGVTIKFQSGAAKEVGVNGLTCEALIVCMLDRLRCFQDGPLKCSENDMVILHLESALSHCVRRTQSRAAAGVKGTSKPIPGKAPSESDHYERGKDNTGCDI